MADRKYQPRTPVGRNFEGYGRTRTWLGAWESHTSKPSKPKEIPSVKHFAANNEEYERHRIDEKIDERTLHEIYFPHSRRPSRKPGVGGDVGIQQG